MYMIYLMYIKAIDSYCSHKKICNIEMRKRGLDFKREETRTHGFHKLANFGAKIIYLL